jgi:hypothetical protein
MTAPISNIYRCGCHGALECPDRNPPEPSLNVIGVLAGAVSGAIGAGGITAWAMWWLMRCG